MRSAILLLGLVALTRAWSWRDRPQQDKPHQPVQLPAQTQACHCPYSGGHGEEEDEVLAARLREGSFFLDNLEKELEKVEGNFKELGQKARKFIAEVDSDVSRLERLEGRECGDREFYCGANSHQCIGHLLACDKDPECRNGADESEETCTNHAAAGSVFEAKLDGNDPCTIRKPTKLRVVVTSSEAKEYLPSIEKVRASVEVTFLHDHAVQVDVLNSDGYYTYGRQALVLHPPDLVGDNRLMLALIFDDANHDIARGIVFHEATKDVCIRFEAHRV